MLVTPTKLHVAIILNTTISIFKALTTSNFITQVYLLEHEFRPMILSWLFNDAVSIETIESMIE
jgi:hypothetical protein